MMDHLKVEVKQEAGSIIDAGDDDNSPANISENEMIPKIDEENVSGESYQEFQDEEEFDFNFSLCSKSSSSKELNSKTRVMWTLEKIGSIIDLESVAGGAECVVQLHDEDGEEILLRFYLDKFELATRMDERVRYLSLYVSVLKGGNSNGEGFNFTVKVDRLTDSFWKHFNQMPETAVYMRTSKDRRGKLVEKYFLRYMRSPIPVESFRGRVDRGDFKLELEEVEDLHFGLCVTLISSKTSQITAIQASNQMVPLPIDEVAVATSFIVSEKETPPVSQDTSPLPASEETLPPSASKEATPLPAALKEVLPPQVKKEVLPPQVKKEVLPPQVKKEVLPPQVTKEASLLPITEEAPLGSKGVGRGRGRGKPRQD